ncbi:MAG: aminomethyl-transferring glycine dehydrogenase subunit GcvPA [Pleomorphochaeta sp.]
MSYTVASAKEKKEMLNEIGLSSINELFKDIPNEVILNKPINIDEGKSEFEVLEELSELSKKNVQFKTTFRGAGSYKHLIPEVVKHLSSLSGFVTSYTPYQAELSQGYLQAIFEYQSEICNLFDMDVSNSSIYDGASAVSEAMILSLAIKGKKVFVSKAINPRYLETIKTYANARDILIEEIDVENGLTSINQLKQKDFDGVSTFIFQSPNYFGLIEDSSLISEIVKSNKVEPIVIVNPIAMGVLKTPRECGIDIVCGEAQPLGLDQAFGGPYLGYIATSQKYLRKIPGRIVGKTVDRNNKESFVLTLQAREQHIRREKASSSICSNQALSALRCAIYMGAMGKEGLKEVSKRCLNNAHYALDEIIKIPGFRKKYNGEFFNEFVIETDYDVDEINLALKTKSIQGPFKLNSTDLLVCVTEANSKKEIDLFVKTLVEVTQ